MTDTEYLEAQRTLLYFSAALAMVDWDAFRQRIDHAETVGPFLMEPMAYQRAVKVTARLTRLARAAGVLASEWRATEPGGEL